MRDELFASLGRFCAHCGSEDQLEFDVLEPMGDRHHRMNALDRAYFYRKQHAIGNLQVLCGPCNRWKGSMDLETYRTILPF